MKISETSIPGCFIIDAKVFSDVRGIFVKTFVKRNFVDQGLVCEFAEEYFTVSGKNVLRGLHFQTPPYDHVKVVSCLHGAVLDAVVDIRAGSPTYGRHELFELDGKSGRILYLPSGVAHGFLTLSDDALMSYKVTADYSPTNDTGIHWSSAGISWPCSNPMVSDRDSYFQPLAGYDSPFNYKLT
jgi:dTDP-4-dehydrorhamnose 3,5-epimerase